MSTAIATPMSSATSFFMSKLAVGVDVAIGFVYCYFYCLKWQNQAVDIAVGEGFGFSLYRKHFN